MVTGVPIQQAEDIRHPLPFRICIKQPLSNHRWNQKESVSGNPVILTFFGMSAGTALAIMNYISQIFTPVENLGMEIQTIQSALAGIYRINEFYELEEEMPDDVKIKDIANESRKTTPVVLFDDVRFGYDEHAVLDHVSFHVEEGEQVTLSGRTGAGLSLIHI